MCECRNLEDLLDAERPALKAAFGHRRYLISKRMSKNPEDIDWNEAQSDFMTHYFNAWAEGFKMSYCTYVCKDRGNCEIGSKEIEKWTQYAPDDTATKQS